MRSIVCRTRDFTLSIYYEFHTRCHPPQSGPSVLGARWWGVVLWSHTAENVPHPHPTFPGGSMQEWYGCTAGAGKGEGRQG